jgi:hypothetical protein
MPTPPSDKPLLKVTINLFREDVEWFRRRYGQGWSTHVRDLIADHVNDAKERYRIERDK